MKENKELLNKQMSTCASQGSKEGEKERRFLFRLKFITHLQYSKFNGD